MARVNSLKSGYLDETGVMSAAPTSATSAMIKHNVMLRGGSLTYLNSVAFSSSTGIDGGTIQGSLCCVDGRPATLALTKAAAATVVLNKIGGVIQVSGAASQPFGQSA